MNQLQDIRIQKAIGITGICIILAGILFFSGKGCVFDEFYYQQNISLLRYYGLSDAFLLKVKGPAGPSYTVLHYLLYPITKGRVIPVRLVNTALLLSSILIFNRILDNCGRLVSAWTLLAVPMTFVCGGLALTEMPALFFLVCSIFFMQWFVEQKKNYLLVIAALFYSFSILGRQPYLLLLPVFVYYLFYPFKLKDISLMLFFGVVSLLLPVYCFVLWRGLIPVTGNIAEAGSLAYHHFFLACGYSMLAFLFAIPAFIVHPRRLGYPRLVALLVFTIIISVIFKFEYAMMSPLATRLLPAKWYPYFLNLGFAFLLFMSLYFIATCLIRFFESYKDRFMQMAYLCMFALLVSTMTITHQFSSRYVFQLTPFIFITGSKFNKPGISSNILRTMGLVVGTLALFSYYNS